VSIIFARQQATKRLTQKVLNNCSQKQAKSKKYAMKITRKYLLLTITNRRRLTSGINSHSLRHLLAN